MSMSVDMSDFEKGLAKLAQKVEPQATARGLFAAGNQLLRDAIGEKNYAPFHVKDPTDPRDKLGGALRASATTQTPDGKMRAMTSATPADAGKSNEITAGFNIVYAARWHELTPAEDAKINWTLSGAGRKYLESKMATYKQDYMEIVGEFLKKALGGGHV